MANLRVDNLTGTGGRNAIDGSVFFGGTGDYLSIDDSTDLELGSGDFTIEGWFYFGNNGSSGTSFWAKWNSPNRSYTFAYVKSTGTYTFGYSTDGSAEVLLTSAALSADINTWVHFAAVRNGSSLKVYRNGISIIDASVGSATFYNATTDLYIGRLQSNTNYDYNGYVSNFRLIKGTALYTAAFTPPTQKLTAVENTVLLCCQDSNDALQEATGKTITGQGRYEYLSGTNLVTNGSGNSVSGWTDSNTSTFASTNGRIQVTRSGGVGNCSYQAITTIVGQQYTIRANIEKGSGSYGDIRVYTDSGFGTFLVILRSDANTSGLRETTFTATTTTTHLTFVIDSNGETAYYSDISVIAANPGKAPRVLPPVGVDEGVTFDGGIKKNTQGYMYFPTGDTSQRGRGTALFGGGYKTPNSITAIDYLSIQSGGLTQEWGNLSTTQLASGAALSSNTRYVKGGGWVSPLNNNAIEYVTFTTSGNSLEFGDLSLGRRNLGTHSNDTRGLWAGGYISPADAGTDTIDYVTIASTGNAVDFGNLSAAGKSTSGTGSTTRAVFTLGNVAPVGASNVFEYVTIASAGDYTNFGDLEDPLRDNGTCSNGTRAVFAGGTRFPHSAVINTLQFITIASTGDTTNFGDLTLARGAIGGTSNGTRGVFMGGTTNPARQNTIDSIIIATTGEAVNWGEFITAKQGLGSAASDSHGGLS